MKRILICFVFSLFLTHAKAQKKVTDIIKILDAKSETYGAIAQNIWELAEMGYLEEKSAALLQKTLKDEGFAIKSGVAGIPTAFVSEYGSGIPVIAILGEYDALPGLSQQAVAEKRPAGKGAGHAYQHHLFGTASTAGPRQNLKNEGEQNFSISLFWENEHLHWIIESSNRLPEVFYQLSCQITSC